MKIVIDCANGASYKAGAKLLISLGAKVGKNSPAYDKISRYLFSVRILILIIAIVSLILWLLL